MARAAAASGLSEIERPKVGGFELHTHGAARTPPLERWRNDGADVAVERAGDLRDTFSSRMYRASSAASFG
jgi:hypothetical protein